MFYYFSAFTISVAFDVTIGFALQMVFAKSSLLISTNNFLKYYFSLYKSIKIFPKTLHNFMYALDLEVTITKVVSDRRGSQRAPTPGTSLARPGEIASFLFRPCSL